MDTAAATTHEWALQTFGHVRFPDRRNVALAVRIAEGLVDRPFACVSKAFPDEALRQAVYDLGVHPHCTAPALLRAPVTATARAARHHPFSIIPIDGVCLTLHDPLDQRGTGSIGERKRGARGLNVMDAVGLSPTGEVLGLAGLVSWARPHTKNPRRARQRPLAEKETKAWMELREQIREAYEREAPETTRIFLHDSGADAWPILLDILVHDAHPGEITIVRAGQNRRASCPTDSDPPSHLWPLLESASLRAYRWLFVPRGHGLPARRAWVEVSTRPVTLDLKLTPSNQHVPATLQAVYVREIGGPPAGQKKLDLMLLTNAKVSTLAEAEQVVNWYALRWRIEDQHKAWKKGGADIESMQLRKPAAMLKWMIWHAAVAARALQLVHQSRDPEQGSEPAETVFTAEELEGLRRIRAGYGRVTPEHLTVAEAVGLIASLGGYDKRKDRRPGPMVVQRGLEMVLLAALVVGAPPHLLSPPGKKSGN